MPAITQTQAGGGSQFAGTTDANGLFAFRNTGSPWVQVRIKSIIFYTASTIVGWTLNFIDPDGNVSLWQSGSTTNFALADGTQGIIVLPLGDDNVPWSLSFTTNTMAAAGSITIDYDFIAMQ